MSRTTTPHGTSAAGAAVLTLPAAIKPKRTRKTTATRRAATSQSATVHALADYRRPPAPGASKGRLTITDFGDGQRDVAVSGTFDNDPLHSIRALCTAMFSIVRRVESDIEHAPRAPSCAPSNEYSS